MQVSDPNNVKIYNLTAGKSLPDWLTDRKKRALLKNDIDLRKRIELLQDFEMPDLSNCIRVSKDGHYILATGIYKPRVRCYEVDNLSMKFERCMDAEIVSFEVLSDDYSKLVFLQNDRHVEFHAAGGVYHKLRIPKYGRDMKYHYSSCDLYVVGASTDIYRFNLERGQFLNSLVSEASEIHKIVINPVHELICVGTKEGKVEAWDPRIRNKVGNLDVAEGCLSEDTQVDGFPSVTSLQFNGALTLGVGTATGQVLLYDLRSNKPYRVKDHMYGNPILDVVFHDDYVLSLDKAILKIWEKDNGKLYTSIESGDFTYNQLCHVPNSGLMFMTNESPKIYCYYIPSLGPAPKWCSFLDNLTEELEESRVEEIYDDYKFVTKKELEELNLSHLVGTQMLRAYMHGYFMSIRLYNKAKSLSESFNYEQYKKQRIREKIESERESRVQIKSLPKVNKDLALKLMDDTRKPKNKKTASLLEDDRFKQLFENPDFQIDTKTEEYRLLNPVISRLDKGRKKELEKELLQQQLQTVQEEEEEIEGKASSDESSSSDDDMDWVKEVKAEHRKLKKEKDAEERRQLLENDSKVYELKPGTVFNPGRVQEDPMAKLSLGRRLKEEKEHTVKELQSGNKEMTFTITKKKKKGDMDPDTIRKHREERRAHVRPPPTRFRMPSRTTRFKRRF